MNYCFFYYERDCRKRPVKTICIASIDSWRYARGIAICSKKDHPCKKIGRQIAEGRALKCAQTQKSYYDKGGTFLVGEFRPSLTQFESHIMLGIMKGERKNDNA